MKISVIKNSRTVEIPASATREELLSIISKWASVIAGDPVRTAYKIVETGSKSSASQSSPSSFDDVFSQFGDIFGNLKR
jgi:hypothetical protein